MKMIDYIYDQPSRLKKILASRDDTCIPLLNYIEKNQIKRVYLTGSGTSYHAALLMKMYFDQYTDFETSVSIPTFFSRYEILSKNYKKEETMLIAISQSGTSISSINAVKKGNQLGIQTVALTEDLNSLITNEAGLTIHLNCGKEKIPIETRGYTATVFTAILLAVEIGKQTGNLSELDYTAIMETLEKDIGQLPTAIEHIEEWYLKNKYELISMEKGAIAGYGYHYVTAMEGYLKMYETFHKPLSAHELEELLHGYEMAFDSKQYIFMIASEGEELHSIDKFRSFLDQLTEHQFVITNQTINLRSKDLSLAAPVSKVFSPILFILPFQLMAARNCESIGYDTSIYPHKIRSFSHVR
ncbi:SIS domain-containing protein [Neobacillus drentensis]|uniref:SIS domain-containing protein n=1 Tax=Neobacillus drentensis TaxID=220684 RepID=UPI001F17B492|nr:SIS domain-containing protein [Neobacillus drentensis]ULT59573.1 SIS domain-containing protein [Neobacillus drentensis]